MKNAHSVLCEFVEWLEKQEKRDDPIGDLANDRRREQFYRQTHGESCGDIPDDVDSFGKLRSHIFRMPFCGCREAHQTMTEAWVEFITKRRSRLSVTLKMRFEVFKRDNYRCCVCGRDAKDGTILELDHKHPVAAGGLATRDNLWTLCFECNRGKRAAAV